VNRVIARKLGLDKYTETKKVQRLFSSFLPSKLKVFSPWNTYLKWIRMVLISMTLNGKAVLLQYLKKTHGLIAGKLGLRIGTYLV